MIPQFRTLYVLPWIALTAILLAACHSTNRYTEAATVGPSTNLVVVATINDQKPSQVIDIVQRLLASENIQAVIEGSLLYPVMVKASDADAAAKILNGSPALKGRGLKVLRE